MRRIESQPRAVAAKLLALVLITAISSGCFDRPRPAPPRLAPERAKAVVAPAKAPAPPRVFANVHEALSAASGAIVALERDVIALGESDPALKALVRALHDMERQFQRALENLSAARAHGAGFERDLLLRTALLRLRSAPLLLSEPEIEIPLAIHHRAFPNPAAAALLLRTFELRKLSEAAADCVEKQIASDHG